MLNAGPEYSEPFRGRSLRFCGRGTCVRLATAGWHNCQEGNLGACDKYSEQWMRFSCICWRRSPEEENKEPFSGQVSHHPLLFWLSAALPDVNLLPRGTLVKWIGRQVNTKIQRGEERTGNRRQRDIISDTEVKEQGGKVRRGEKKDKWGQEKIKWYKRKGTERGQEVKRGGAKERRHKAARKSDKRRKRTEKRGKETRDESESKRKWEELKGLQRKLAEMKWKKWKKVQKRGKEKDRSHEEKRDKWWRC